MEQNRFKEAIDNLKKAGKNSYTLTCENGKQCLLREPTVQESSKIIPYIMGFADQDPDFVKGGKILVKECWIAGDDEIRKDEELLAEVAFAAISVMNMKVADVKKN